MRMLSAMRRSLAGVCALMAAVQSARAVADAAARTPPPAVLWYAPFLSGGGYCSEAHSYVTAISSALRQAASPPSGGEEERGVSSPSDESDFGAFSSSSYHDASSEEDDGDKPFTLLVTQHGDSLNPGFIRDMPEEMREVLEEVTPPGCTRLIVKPGVLYPCVNLMYRLCDGVQHWIEERDFYWRLKDKKIALAICHSEPGAWDPPRYHTSRCPPRGAVYKVGRTMFETDRVPSGWADRMNKMDEIWVPTKCVLIIPSTSGYGCFTALINMFCVVCLSHKVPGERVCDGRRARGEPQGRAGSRRRALL